MNHLHACDVDCRLCRRRGDGDERPERRESRPVRTGPDDEVRHLVYIATPGDNGTDNQSGVVVLDADKGYSFSNASRTGCRRARCRARRCRASTVSVPLQMLYVDR